MYTSYYHSQLGLIKITASGSGLQSVLFTDEGDGSYMMEPVPANDITQLTVRQLDEYFSGGRQHFDIPLAPQGTDFQQNVWKELVNIPFGKTDSYAGIAGKLNNPLSIRAVGAANGRNPISIIIPCHRVIGSDGSLTGYAGGLWRKEYLLHLEGAGKPRQQKLW